MMTLRHSPNLISCFSSNSTTIKRISASNCRRKNVSLISKMARGAGFSITCSAPKISEKSSDDLLGNSGGSRYCSCCLRRHLLGSLLGFPALPAFASEKDPTLRDPVALFNKIRPPRPDWYEELYALAMDKATKSYEAEIAGYKSQLFAKLRGNAEKVLEIGVGTGPNLRYYADCPGIFVFGVDPNQKMEKYAQAAAETAGLAPSNFRFMQGVAEALPLNDASVDAVVGTIVLCSVNNVDQALQEVKRVLKPGGFYIFIEHVAAKDGTILRFVQGILNPLQQFFADGCHLTRNTATNIDSAGFASVDVNQVVLSSASLVNPHVYGIAHK